MQQKAPHLAQLQACVRLRACLARQHLSLHE